MAIQVGWDDDGQHIVRMIFDREWTWPDFHDALHMAAELQAAVARPIGLIHDVPVQVGLPEVFLSNIGAFLECRVPVDIHTAVVITPDLLSEMMVRAIFRIYGDEQAAYVIFPAHTVEQARDIILRRASELGVV